MVKAALPFERGIRIVRYLNSAYILGYIGLSKVYSYEEFFKPMNRRYNLLTDEEYKCIRRINQCGHNSDNVREVVTWCITDVHIALKQGYIDAHTAQDLRGQILKVRAIIADMYDHYDQPLLFIYVHFIVILTAIYLPLAAVYISHEVATSEAAHWFNDVIGLLALLLQCMFVIGVRYVAQVMRIPYAGELESLPVLSFVEGCCDMSMRIMYSTGYKIPEHSVERLLTKDRDSLGAFWDGTIPSETFDPKGPNSPDRLDRDETEDGLEV